MKAVEDVVKILVLVRKGILKFYIDDNYIICENTRTTEKVIVGDVKNE